MFGISAPRLALCAFDMWYRSVRYFDVADKFMRMPIFQRRYLCMWVPMRTIGPSFEQCGIGPQFTQLEDYS